MPSHKTIIEANDKFGPQLKNLVTVIVGGTSGIGEYTAYNFAKYTKSPSIYIVGRNKEAGSRVIENLKALNNDTDSHYYFHSHDLTLVSEAEKFSKTVLDNEEKVNVLIVAPGYMSLEKKRTDEGIDKKMAINYYSRWKIVDRLLPLLSKAANSGETARVVSILNSNRKEFAYPDDIGLKLDSHYSILNTTKHSTMLNSLAVLHLSRQYPNISFTHAFPGFVKTGLGRDLPWYLRSTMNLLGNVFATSSMQSGEIFFYVSAIGKEFNTGSHLINQNCDPIFKNPDEKGYLWDHMAQEKAWDHTLEEFKRVSNNSKSTT